MNDTPSNEIERQLSDLDIELKRIDLQIKILELERSRRGVNWTIILPVLGGIIGAVIALLSNVVANYLDRSKNLVVEQRKADAQLELEDRKLQANLILEAVKTGDQKKAADNLRFFAAIGLLKDPYSKIEDLVAKGQTPTLPIPNASIGHPTLQNCKEDVLSKREADIVVSGSSAYVNSCVKFVRWQDVDSYMYVFRVENRSSRVMRIEYEDSSGWVSPNDHMLYMIMSADEPASGKRKIMINGESFLLEFVYPSRRISLQ